VTQRRYLQPKNKIHVRVVVKLKSRIIIVHFHLPQHVVITGTRASGSGGGGSDGEGKVLPESHVQKMQNPIRHKIILPFEKVCPYLFRFRGVSQPAQVSRHYTIH
jgi:hypothetical protein